MSIEIKSLFTGRVLHTVGAASLRGADLRDADLYHADLRGARRGFLVAGGFYALVTAVLILAFRALGIAP